MVRSCAYTYANVRVGQELSRAAPCGYVRTCTLELMTDTLGEGAHSKTCMQTCVQATLRRKAHQGPQAGTPELGE